MTTINQFRIPFLILFSFFTTIHFISAQCAGSNQVQVCDLSATIANVENATIVGNVTNSTIDGSVDAGGQGIGTPFTIQATGLGVVKINVSLSFTWDKGVNDNWIHGVSIQTSDGFTYEQGNNPGSAWIFQNSITGCCSGTTYGPGYYFDGTEASSNCCGGGTPNNGNPADNYGINCTTDCAGAYVFDLEYCPISNGIINESVTFVLTEDGETGDWAQPAGGVFRLTFPVTILPAEDVTTGNDGLETEGENIVYYCARDSVLLGLNQAFDSYEWSTGSIEDAIYVYPESDSTIYSVKVKNDIGCDVNVEFKAVLNPSCNQVVDAIPASSDMLILEESDDVECLVRENLMSSLSADVSNITTNGGVIGTFSSGSSNIGFENGIVLCNAPLSDFEGSNTNTDQGGFVNSETSLTDIDLSQMSVNSVRDVSVIEFDFVPTEDKITFDVIIASDEFCEYTPTIFSDVFGFFLSGPQINGSFSNNAINIATFPNTDDVISLNTVHYYGQYSDYYISNLSTNTSSSFGVCTPDELNSTPCCIDEVAFDGFTKSIKITADVIPNQTHHIKFALGDATDALFGTAVFIKSKSFSIGDDDVLEEINYVSGETITLETDDNYYEYLWSTGEISSTIEVTPSMDSTIYSVTVSYLDGCSIFKDYLLVEESSCSTIPPANFLNPPPNITLQCGDPVPSAQDLAFDNNDPNNPNSGMINPIEIDQTNPCTGGTIQYIWSGTDNCGNSLEHEQIITISPAPLASFVNTPINITLACNDDIPPMADLQYSNFSADPCQNTGLIVGIEDNQLSDCGSGTITRTWSGTDNCGNSFAYTQTITVTEPLIPVFEDTPIASIEIECGEAFPTPAVLMATGYFNGDCNGMAAIQAQTEMISSDCAQSMINTWSVTDDCGNFSQFNQVITSLCSSLDVDAGEDITLNCDGSMLNLEGSVFSDNATVQWSTSNGMIAGGGNTLTPLINGAGMYIMTAINSNNCTGTDTVMVMNASNLEIELFQTQNIECDPSSETTIVVNVIAGNPPYTYLWSDGSTNDVIANAATGTYIVTVSDNGGCSVIDSITVVEFTLLEATIEYENQVFNCSNNPPAYEVVATGGIQPYTYLWADGSTGTIPASLGNSFGQVTVTDASGCTATTQAELIEDFEEPEFDLSATTITCVNPFGTATATVTNADDFIIIWTNEAGQGISISETVEVDIASQVCATVTNNENGCMSMQCIEILENTEPPTISLAVSNVIDCIDTTATILTNVSGQSDIIYEWMFNDESFDMPDNLEVSGIGTYSVTITDSENGCTATNSIDVLQDESVPVISVSVLDMITCSNPTVSIVFEGSQGTNFSNEWMFNNEPFMMSANLVVNQSGMYSLVTTNTETGCSTEASVDVFENVETPVFEVNSTVITCIELQSICSVSNINIDNYSVEWFNSENQAIANSETITVDEIGLYCAIITNIENGCTNQECIEVLEDLVEPVTSLSVSNELNCRDTTATIIVDGQNTNSTYNWTFNNDPNVIGADFMVSESGTFSITTTDTDNGCTSVASIEVIDISTEVIASAGEDVFIELDCGETPDYPITLDATSTGNQNQYEYQWILNNDTLPNSNTLLFDVFETGMYVLEVTNMNNFCSDKDTVLVDITGANFPEAIITSDGSLNCDQDEVLLDAINSISNSEIIDYQWISPDGAFLSNNSTQAITLSGIYSVIVTNAEGCTNQETFEVVQDSINAMIVSNGQLNCLQEEVLLDATSSISTLGVSNYQWFDTAGALISTDETLTVVEAGYYSVIVSDGQGCTDQQLIQVTEDEIDVTFNNEIPLCFDDEINLNVDVVGTNPPFILDWSNGDMGDSTVITAQTLASLTVTDSIGCIWNVSPEDIDFPLPLFVENIDIINETDSSSDGSVFVEASGGALPYTYLWNTGETTASISDLAADLYAVTVTDANNCEFIIDAILVDMVTSTNLISDSNIQVSPNPSNGILNINYTGSSFVGTIHFYNQLGQKVHQENQVSFGRNDTNILIPSTVIDGMYIFSIEENGAPVYFEKVILNR